MRDVIAICKHCGKPLDYFPTLIDCLQWKHQSGFYGCDDRRPSRSETHAEPVEVYEAKEGAA